MSQDYKIEFENMQPKSVYPSDNNKLDASNDVIQYAMKIFTEYNFTLSEVKGCLSRISDFAMRYATVNYKKSKNFSSNFE